MNYINILENEFELQYLILETICSFSILTIIIYERFKAKSNILMNQLVLALLEILILGINHYFILFINLIVFLLN